MINDVLLKLIGMGPIGIILAGLLVWIWQLHLEIRESEKRRIEDAQAYTVRALDLQKRIYQQIEKLHLIVEAVWPRGRGSMPSITTDSEPPDRN